MFILLIWILPLCLPVFSQSSVDEQCFKYAENYFNRSLEGPPKFSVPDEFKAFKELINQIKIVISNIKNTNGLKKKLNNSKDKLNKSREQLKLIKVGSDLLRQIKEGINKLKKQKTFNKDTKEVCSTATEKYDKLRKDVDFIEKQKPKLDDTLEKLKENVDKINAQSMAIKESLDKTRVPDYDVDKYLCDKDIFVKFKKIVEVAHNIKNILKRINENLRSELKTLRKKLNRNINLEEIPEMPLTDAEIQQEIKYFNKKLKEVKKLSTILDLKKKLEIELDDVEQKVINLCINGVCKIRVPVDVEN